MLVDSAPPAAPSLSVDTSGTALVGAGAGREGGARGLRVGRHLNTTQYLSRFVVSLCIGHMN